MKISLIPLEELLQRKMTPSVESAIQAKIDFSNINEMYCEKVCRLKCKAHKDVRLLDDEVDILIVQDHKAPRGKYDRTDDASERVSYDIIQQLCLDAGFGGLRYRITNLLKCKPSKEDFPLGKAPTMTVLSKCKPYLLGEIERCKPKVIISLSTAVTKALGYKKHSNNGNRGEIIDNRVVLTLHPRVLTMIRQNASGAMWGVDFMKVIIRDFRKAAQLARNQLTVPPLEEAVKYYVDKRITFARSLDDVKKIMDMLTALPTNMLISWDTETTSLDGMAPNAKLLTTQFGWRDPISHEIRAAVIPLWHRKNSFYNPDEAWALVAPFLTGQHKKIGHNIKFDVLFTYYTTGVRAQNIAFDTMLVLHGIDSGTQGTFSLKKSVWDFMPETGLGGYEDQLPKLTKVKGQMAEDEDENEDEDEVTE